VGTSEGMHSARHELAPLLRPMRKPYSRTNNVANIKYQYSALV
jgi:hypothetical protein